MKRRKGSIVVKLLLIAVAVYTVVQLINLQIAIYDKKAEAADLQGKVELQRQKNDTLQKEVDRQLTEEQIKRIARDKLGLSEDGEQVFVNISGD